MAHVTIKHPKKRAFLAAFSELGSITEAALVAKVSRELHYDWRAQDPDYAAAFTIAQERAGDALEDEAHRRARGYVYEEVDDGAGGKKVVRRNMLRCSDRVLLRLLEGAKPEKYGRKTHNEITGKDGGPIQIERIERVIVDPQNPDS